MRARVQARPGRRHDRSARLRAGLRNPGDGVRSRDPDASIDDPSNEDDGWIMSYVHDATTDTANVVILDAQNFSGEPVATVHLPQRVPFGFHGNWVPTGK